MGQYSIKEVETLSGVKAHTLRIWEQRYDFLKPNRTDTNIRYYTDEQLRLLLNIGTLNRNGMKISKIAELGKEELSKQVMEVYADAVEPDSLLDSLIHSMIDFDERRFEKTLSSAIVKLGFEKCFTELVFPFLQRTGSLWTTGAVNVAQEHFISNLIRRKIFVAIDNLFVEEKEDSKRFVLFLPEGETHDVLLLFTEYLLRKRNHEVIYLGASMPIVDIHYIIKRYKPNYLVTFATVPLGETSLSSYLKKLLPDGAKCKIMVGGAQLEHEKPIHSSSFIYISSAEDLLAAIV